MTLLRDALGLVLVALSSAACINGASGGAKYEPPDERIVLFASGSADAGSTEGYFALGYVVALLDEHPSYHALIIGHADSKGSADANREICFRRARAVRKVLMEHGADAKRLLIGAPRVQEGVSMPALSRRADVYVYDPVQDEVSKRLGYQVDLRSE